MTYIDYIKAHSFDIESTSKKVAFKDIYKKSFDDIKNDVFQKVLAEFKEKKEIGRDDIFKKLSSKNLTESFFRIILWGGLNPANINRVMSVSDCIETKLKNTYSLINGDVCDNSHRDLSVVFRELSFGGNNHIDGISTSFFTKVMYFFDRSKECLIYDRWGRLQHCALIASMNDPSDSVENYYTLTNENDKIVLSIAKGKSEWDLYRDYINRMQRVSSAIKQKKVDKLEEFLFGYYQRKYDENNPRYFLLNYLIPRCKVVDCTAKTPQSQIRRREIWRPFCALKSLTGTTHTNASLVKGYNVPIDKEEFRVFVAERKKKNKDGLKFYCNLMYKNGKETNFSLLDYPRANEIVRDFFDYNNKGYKYNAYWFQYFNNEKEAIDFLNEVYEMIHLYYNE